MKEKYLNLEKSLKHDNFLNIGEFDLFFKLNIIINLKNDKLIDILNYIKIINSFSNRYITNVNRLVSLSINIYIYIYIYI